MNMLSPGVLFQSRTTQKGVITMTENEAIELLRSMQNPKQDYADVVCAPAFCTGFRFVYPEPEDYAIEEAIKALKEIQQYREIGTVEECREAAELKHERSQSTEALVYQTPTTVMLICLYCDHENDYEYDDFCSDNGAPPDWDYTKIECKECHRIFQIQGQDWL